jgi:hypothetical protein
MDIEVYVPDAEFRAGDQIASYWHGSGGWFAAMKRALGAEMAISLMLSRATTELRRELGVDGAKDTLRLYIETMEEAAKGDGL